MAPPTSAANCSVLQPRTEGYVRSRDDEAPRPRGQRSRGLYGFPAQTVSQTGRPARGFRLQSLRELSVSGWYELSCQNLELEAGDSTILLSISPESTSGFSRSASVQVNWYVPSAGSGRGPTSQYGWTMTVLPTSFAQGP